MTPRRILATFAFLALASFGLALASGAGVALAQSPALLVEYRIVTARTGGATVIRVTDDGEIERREEPRTGPPQVAHRRLSAAELARARTAVQDARIAGQPTAHRGPSLPDPVHHAMTLPRRAHVAWSSGDTPPAAVAALATLLQQLAPPVAPVAPDPPTSSGPPRGGADS